MDYSLIRIWVSWAGGPQGRCRVGLTRTGPPPGGAGRSVRTNGFRAGLLNTGALVVWAQAARGRLGEKNVSTIVVMLNIW